MVTEELKTDRLILRKVTQETYDYLFSSCNEKEIRNFLGLYSKEAFDRETTRHQKGFSTFNKTFLYFLLVNQSTNKVIGWCGFHTWYLDHSRAEIGYGIYDEADRKAGLMTEAIKPIIYYGFNQMKLHRIEAFVSPENTPPIRLVSNLGFQKEGVLREHFLSNGKLEHSAVYSLLKTD